MHGNCGKLYAFNTRAKVVRVLCGQWSCTACSKTLARLWAWRVKLECATWPDQHAYFVTFTLPAYIGTPYLGYIRIKELWDRYRREMHRSIAHSCYKGLLDWKYCAFVEGQPKRGYMPHFHIIQNTLTPRVSNRALDPIKDFATSLGWGFEAHEDLVTGKRAAGYCAKYASKISPSTPKNFRRVRTSQKWAKLPPADYPALIVKSRLETTGEYIMRVADATGADHQTLLDRWVDVTGLFGE